jgi:Right handed beta helix region
VIGWNEGILALGSGKTVKKNQVSQNSIGIDGRGDTAVLGNVVVNNYGHGITLSGTATAIGNAVHGNGNGLNADSLSSLGRFERNNVTGNLECGLRNSGSSPSDVNAQNNYWGAATGPGSDPADNVCDSETSTTLTTPFATAPFAVNAPIKP